MSGQKIDLETLMTFTMEKKCACGHVHTKLPYETIVAAPFYYFDCVCKSTLVVKIPKETNHE